MLKTGAQLTRQRFLERIVEREVRHVRFHEVEDRGSLTFVLANLQAVAARLARKPDLVEAEPARIGGGHPRGPAARVADDMRYLPAFEKPVLLRQRNGAYLAHERNCSSK